MTESTDYKKLARYAECRKKLLSEASVLITLAKEKAWEEGNMHEWSILDFAAEYLRKEAIQAASDAVFFENYQGEGE